MRANIVALMPVPFVMQPVRMFKCELFTCPKMATIDKLMVIKKSGADTVCCKEHVRVESRPTGENG